MLMLLRSMAPEVIAIDELGGMEELDALRRAANCGCRILATAHGENLEEVQCRFGVDRDFWDSFFGLYLVLCRKDGKCVVKQALEGREAFA